MAAGKATIKSPCIGICDVFDGLCMGCFRDIHEISDWHEMSDEQRRALLVDIEQRRKQFKTVAEG